MHIDVSRLQVVVSRALGRDGSHLSISPIPGGLTNMNYRVDAEGEVFVLRVPGKSTNLLGISRENELHNQRVASSLGVAPEVIAYIEPEGYILSRFVPGARISPEAMLHESTIERICKSLRRIHDGPAFSGSFDAFSTCEQYRLIARRSGIQEPSNLDEIFQIAHQIELACRSQVQTRPCHNDLLNENFLDFGTKVWILDWEYSGMGDLFFDLGNFAAHQQLSNGSEEFLLRCYFGQYRQSDHARLKLSRIVSDIREAMWGVAQEALSTLDLDFAKYTAGFVARVATQVSDAGYSKWLDLVAKNG